MLCLQLHIQTMAEYIIHSNKSGIFKEILVDDLFAQKHVVECDMWVESGTQVSEFSGANAAIGTLVLHFHDIDEARSALQNIKQFVSVAVE